MIIVPNKLSCFHVNFPNIAILLKKHHEVLVGDLFSNAKS
jgi:hypothetical protein